MSAPFRVLFLCTGNSARSQIAQALLTHLGGDRFEAASAGTAPEAQINPGALEALAEARIPWRGNPPRNVDGLENEQWNLVVTVCDDARESCPVLPAPAIKVHWGMPIRRQCRSLRRETGPSPILSASFGVESPLS